MIPTLVANEVITKFKDDGTKVLRRSYGAVIKELQLSPDIMNEGTGFITLHLNSDDKELTLQPAAKGKTEITFLADGFGLGGEADIQVVFVNKEKAVITLKSGMLVLKHPEGFLYGIDSKGKLIKPKKYTWFTVDLLYDVCKASIQSKFYPPQNKLDSYIMNAMFALHVEGSTTMELIRRYKVTNMFVTLACGEFEFETYEAPKTYSAKKGREPSYAFPKTLKKAAAEHETIVSEDGDDDEYDELAHEPEEEYDQ